MESSLETPMQSEDISAALAVFWRLDLLTPDKEEMMASSSRGGGLVVYVNNYGYYFIIPAG